MSHKSLKSLWDVVSGFGRGKRDERRCENRLPAHGLVSVCWEVKENHWHSTPVSLVSMSEHGISFRIARSLVIDQRIRVEPQRGTHELFQPFEALVRHVETDGTDFVIGAQISLADGGALLTSPKVEQLVDKT